MIKISALKQSQKLTSRPLLDEAGQSALATLPALFINFGTPNLAITKCSMSNILHRIGQNLPKPKAIVVLSANWQSAQLEINSNNKPLTWHDFSQADDRLYRINYPAAGHSKFAESLAEQLKNKNIRCSLNPVRAYDQGVWVPLSLLYPQADIPVIQLSLPNNFNSYHCYQLGAIFASLRQEQVLIVATANMSVTIDKPFNKSVNQPINENHTQTDISLKNRDFKTWLLRQLKQDIPTALDWQSYFAQLESTKPDDTQQQELPKELVNNTSILPLFFALGAGQRVTLVHESQQSFVSKGQGTTELVDMDVLRFD